jgi:cullin 1
LVQTAFSGEAGFVASLDKACREFVNRNKVCKTSTSKSPELLARFCDSLLKKSAKNPEENELEDVLNGTVRHLEMFQLVGNFRINLLYEDDRL